MSVPDSQQPENGRKAAEERKEIAAARQKEAEAAKAEAESRKATAEADAAAIKAYLPGTPTLEPLKGEVTTDDKTGIVAELAAYALVEGAAKRVAEAVGSKLGEGTRVLVVTDRQLAATDWLYHAITKQIGRLRSELDDIYKGLAEADPALDRPARAAADADMMAGFAPAAVVASSLPAIFGAAADVAGYFQSNYTLAGRAFEAKSEPLIAAVAGALAGAGNAQVVIDGFHTLAKTQIVADYDTMLGARWKVTSGRLGLERRILTPAKADTERCKADFDRRQKALSTAEAANPADPERRAEAEQQVELARERLRAVEAATADLQRLIDVAKAGEQRVDDFVTAVTTAPPAGGLPQLGQAAVREILNKEPPSVTHVCHVSVSSSGGETQIRQRRFFAPTIRYVGACTLSVLLAKTDGTVVYAGSQALVGQLTYLVKGGKLGELQEVKIAATRDQKP